MNVAGKDSRVVVRGAHSLLNFTVDRPWERRGSRLSQMVFIGRDIDRNALSRGFRAYLTRSRR